MSDTNVRFIQCTKAKYDSTPPSDNAIYFITDTQEIYKGSQKFGVGLDVLRIKCPDSEGFYVGADDSSMKRLISHLDQFITVSANEEKMFQIVIDKDISYLKNMSNSSDRLSAGEVFTLYVSPYAAGFVIPLNYGEGVRNFVIDPRTEKVLSNEFVSYLPTWGTL